MLRNKFVHNKNYHTFSDKITNWQFIHWTNNWTGCVMNYYHCHFLHSAFWCHWLQLAIADGEIVLSQKFTKLEAKAFPACCWWQSMVASTFSNQVNHKYKVWIQNMIQCLESDTIPLPIEWNFNLWFLGTKIKFQLNIIQSWIQTAFYIMFQRKWLCILNS